MINLLKLSSHKYFSLFKIKGYLLSLLIVFAITLIFNITGLFQIINFNRRNVLTLINLFISINSLTFFVFMTLITIKLFRTDLADKLVNLETRYGISVSKVFWSRFITTLMIFGSIIIVSLLVNLVIAFSYEGLENVFVYKLFVSSVGWYSFSLALAICVGIFFSSFFKEAIATSFSLIIYIFFMAIAAFGTSYTPTYLSDRSSSIQMYQDMKNAEIYNAAKKISPNLFLIEEFANSIIYKDGPSDAPTTSSNSNFINLTFGPKNWEKWEIDPKYDDLIKMYKYFDKEIFSKKVLSINDDQIYGFNYQSSYPIEPTKQLIKNILSEVKYEYRDLVATMYKFYNNPEALYYLNLQVQFDRDSAPFHSGEQFKKHIKFLGIENDEYLFFKILSFSLKDASSIHTKQELHKNIKYSQKNLGSILNDSFIMNNNVKEYDVRAKEAINEKWWNPITQIGAMFNSTNYSNPILSQILIERSDLFISKNTYFLNQKPSDINSENIKLIRTPQLEIIYFEYSFIFMLIIFGSYFKFRNNILKNK
ncbi:hypothetical protein ESOMN_v1c01210 [Williamsoniiplasma somnilux]|uniref:Uncharacterized protein n=1 Tax=Williamsoniiplasma somnilux TaxID=215578 RepID=A0A2K8NY71_9MOLU|nr:ABC transporter permease [Williamsoniiplasma somnilux]ATZ18506.1 hypothetical protein ESOMN_v1c01210 [Williamsoniiplasma somnilux]